MRALEENIDAIAHSVITFAYSTEAVNGVVGDNGKGKTKIKRAPGGGVSGGAGDPTGGGLHDEPRPRGAGGLVAVPLDARAGPPRGAGPCWRAPPAAAQGVADDAVDAEADHPVQDVPLVHTPGHHHLDPLPELLHD
jgi:hypothetical protein